MSGRVEVCVDNEWGTVCDKWWGNVDANVACGQKGFASRGTQFVVNLFRVCVTVVVCLLQRPLLPLELHSAKELVKYF